MTSQPSATQSARVHVENVGGIDVSTVSLEPGVNVLVGRNGTNRTSFLQAITAVLGSDSVPLKANAEYGRVELELDGETHVRTLQRQNGNVVTDGFPSMASCNRTISRPSLLASKIDNLELDIVISWDA